MEHSLDLLQTTTLDLMQVHNLVDLETQLATPPRLENVGRVRYIGITHYTEGGQAEAARVPEKEAVDFVQINYSLVERGADARIFPIAKDRGGRGHRESSPRARRSIWARSRKGVTGLGEGNRVHQLRAILCENGLSPAGSWPARSR